MGYLLLRKLKFFPPYLSLSLLKGFLQPGIKNWPSGKVASSFVSGSPKTSMLFETISESTEHLSLIKLMLRIASTILFMVFVLYLANSHVTSDPNGCALIIIFCRILCTVRNFADDTFLSSSFEYQRIFFNILRKQIFMGIINLADTNYP